MGSGNCNANAVSFDKLRTGSSTEWFAKGANHFAQDDSVMGGRQVAAASGKGNGDSRSLRDDKQEEGQVKKDPTE
jgi:hypothetical protein